MRDVLVENLSVTNGTLTNNNDGTYKFRGDENFNGTAQLNYLIKDGQGGSVSNTVNGWWHRWDAPVRRSNINSLKIQL